MRSADSDPRPAGTIPCSGWWEQVFYGRQPMEQLALSLQGRHLEGSGSDVVGRFSLTGFVAADGRVSIEKSYRGRHSVLYEGQFDGEGKMWGVWALPGYDGRWMIELGRSGSRDADGFDEIVHRDRA